MKLNKFIIALIALSVTTGSFAEHATANCIDTAYAAGSKHNRFFGDANFSVYNNTNAVQTLTYTVTVCAPNGECNSKTEQGLSVPNAEYHSPPIATVLSTNFSTYGSYYFKVILDVTGFKHLHAEKNCIVRFVS